MSIQRREINGKVRYVARIRDYTGKEKSKTFDKRRDAMKWEAEVLPIIKAKGWTALKAGLTVKEAAVARMNAAERLNTRIGRRHLVNNLGPLADMDVAEVRRGHIVHWVSILIEGREWADGEPLSKGTVVTLLGLLGAVFTHLVDTEKIDRNPCSRVKVPGKPTPSASSVNVPSSDAVLRVVEDGSERFGEGFGYVIKLVAQTGLRASEVSALRCGDVDLDARSISVVRQLSATGEDRPLKSVYSRRTVPLPESLFEVVSQRVEAGSGEDFLFLQMCGRPWTYKRLQRCLRVLGSGFTMHSLRHFCASSLIESGVSVKAVQALLGHATPSITMDVYTHLLSPSLDAVRSASDGIFAG